MSKMKVLSAVMAMLIISLITYANMSTQSTQYVCQDSTSLNDNVIVTIEEYHPWSKLWSQSEGKLTYEIPTQQAVVYNHLVQENKALTIYNQEKTSFGQFFLADKKLVLNYNQKAVKVECIVLNSYCANNLTH